tara:strand:- start:94552 stop:94689 length:138 start_codon:yes stop_codon:yes gene_type:complete
MEFPYVYNVNGIFQKFGDWSKEIRLFKISIPMIRSIVLPYIQYGL